MINCTPLDKSEIQAIKSDNTVKAQVTILETEFKKHVNDFMMIQSMNDANSMQHEEARRMAMKAVKSRLDEIQRKNRFEIIAWIFCIKSYIQF